MKVRGNIIKARRAFVEKSFGDAAWDRVLSTLSEADQKALGGIVIHSAWYDFAVATRLDEAIVNVLGRGDLSVFERMGKHSAQENLNGVHKRLLEPGNPQAFMKKANIIYQFYYGVGKRIYEETGPNSGVMVTHEADTFSEVDCATVVGWYKEALLMCGAKDPRIVETECRARKGKTCRYEVSWS